VASAPRRLVGSLIAVTALVSVAGGISPALAGSTADPIVKQAPPTLIAPANDTTTPVKDVVLQWTKVAYATGYEVQISPNGDFTNNAIELPNNGIVVPTTYEVPLSLPHDEYYWRARGVDAGGHTGWSSQRQFLHDWAAHMTILQQPTTSDPTISWAPVPEASLYRIRISPDPTFNPDNPLTKICWTAGTSYTPYERVSQSEESIKPSECFTQFDPKAQQNYYYEVVAYDDSSATAIKADNAPDKGFECGQAQPECDALTVGALGQFTYQPVAAGATSSSDVTGLKATWHVGSVPGTACDVNSPCPVTPTFSWNPVPGANQYRVYVFRDPYGSNVYRVYRTEWPSLTPREAYQDAQAGQAYYWEVVADTCTSPDPATDPTCPGSDTDVLTFVGSSAITSFAKRSDPVVLQSPTDGATVKTPAVTFSWDDYMNSGNQGSLEARNYHVEISTTKSFDKTVRDIDTVDMTQWTDPSKTLANGVYYWRVQAIDESDNSLTWSNPRMFSFDGAPPTLSITTKSGISVKNGLSIKASEEDIVGTVSPSTVRVIGVSTHKSVPGTWNKTGAATWAFNPSGLLVPGESYALSVSGLRDQAGNTVLATNTSVRTSTLIDDRNPAISYSSHWSKGSSSNAKRGTYSAGSSGTASVTVVGNKISVYGCKGPGFGTAIVRVDGNRQATVREHQEFTQCGVLVWTGPISSTRPHTLQFAQSSGSVALDAVTVG
jgi:hypothetical protein